MFFTQIVDCPEEELAIDMRARGHVRSDVAGAHAPLLPSGEQMTAGNRVAIVGLGYSKVGRNTGLSPNELMIQATKAALDDSGLTVRDIDGITSVGTEPLNDAWMLGVEPLRWWASGMMVPTFAYSAVQAIAAVASGFCHTALALRMIKQQPSGAAMAAGTAAATTRW